MIYRLASLVCICMLMVSGCSLLDDTVRVAPTRAPAADAPQQVQTGPALPGRLLYVAGDQIWMRQGTTAQPLQVEGPARDPAWSPNGQRVAYIHRGESFADLYILDVSSGDVTRVTYNNRTDSPPRTREYVHQVLWAAKPTWSPEGDEIVFLSQESAATGEDVQPAIYEYPLTLYRFPINLSGTREPNNGDMLAIDRGNTDMLAPAWSPDGRYLAYVDAPRGEGTRRVMLYNFETAQAQPYPGIPDGAYDPAWSSDGSQLAFAISQDGATDIYAIGAPSTAGSPRRLTTMGRSRAPAWGPGGGSLAFLNVGAESTDLYIVELSSENGQLQAGNATALTAGADIDATAGLSWSN